MRHVDVVIPVYAGYRETVACLTSVLATVDSAWARIVVVNDCSPDPAITDYLRELARTHPALVLLENPENRGFVATANRGMAYDAQRDVLLLNSDVEVANDWLARLREAAYRHDRVASLTPFSNNATICSFPNVCRDNDLPFGMSVDSVDAFFAQRFSADDVFEVPTGVGFCMYMRRDCLLAVGDFDVATFGRGYGEENDWCQRAVAAGWRNLHLANCFVYHRGGVSFAGEQSPRIQRALQLLDRRYPDYHSRVQRFIARDPARLVRTQAVLGLFAAPQQPRVLLVSHKLGGGAQQHIDELAALYAQQAAFAQITPASDGESVSLTFFDRGRRLRDGLFFRVESQYGQLLAILRALGIGRVHFHHTLGLAPRLWLLAADLGCDYDITIHDYYLINGNPTLTDCDARFVGEDAADFDERCAGHYPLPAGVDGAQWRDNQKLLLDGAARHIFPSADSARRFSRFFSVRPVIAWHPDYAASQPYPQPQWRWSGDRPLRVLVMGALSREKGADVLESVALSLRGARIEFHLLGYAYRALDDCVIAHGPYDNERVHRLVEGIGPDIAWFPALWPETYSYTLSIALHNGLPVVVPDIGAFVERVGARAHSAVVRWDQSTAQWRAFWLGVLDACALPAATAADAPQAIDSSFYAGDYLRPCPALRGDPAAAVLEQLGANLYAHSGELSRAERLLSRMWSLSRHPVAARLVSLIPFKMQQAIKRRLSRRPMHDIVGQ